MKRPLLVVLSLLLCAATCMTWVRSGWRLDQLEWVWRTAGTNYSCVESAGGQLIFLQVWTGGGRKVSNGGELWFTARNRKVSDDGAYLNPSFSWGICGINSQGQRKIGSLPSLASNIYSRELVIPWPWIILIQLAITFWLSRDYWRKSDRDGKRCAACGYDLRATPHRCPECGSIPAG